MCRAWYCVCLLACLGCAGDLSDPKRFDFLIHPDAGLPHPDAAVTDTDDMDSGAGDAGAEADAGVQVPQCVQMVFNAKCNSSACHGEGAPQVNLVSDGVAERVVDQPSSDKLSCTGHTLVATDGSGSLLEQKLMDPPPCGAKMPLVGSLSEAEQACITDWVHDLEGSGGS